MRKLVFLIVFVVAISSCYPQGSTFLKDNYSKKEYMIEMRDGVKLFTAVYSPKDQSKKYPMIMQRTPYRAGPYGEDKFPNQFGPSSQFDKDGFIFVFQDVRGKFMSEGEYVNMRPYIPNKKNKTDIDENTDTYDSIDWLVKNVANNNGNVGIWGISYPGFYAIMSAIDAHPALKAVSPQAPISDWFVGDDMHHNGAFSLLMAFNFFNSFDLPRTVPSQDWQRGVSYDSPDAYKFFMNLGPLKNINAKYYNNIRPFWNQVMQNEVYNSFWQSRNILPHLKNIKPAVLIVGGWFDAEDLYGPLNIYKTIEKNDPNANSSIIMGPWVHGGWSRGDGEKLGDISFDSKTGAYYNDSIIYPFFNYYLKGIGENKIAEATVFRTGENKWYKFDKYPATTKVDTLFFAGNEKLLPKLSGVTKDKKGFVEYVNDPANPVPYTATFQDSRGFYNRTFMIEDQRFASTRPDVVEFETDILGNDLELAGPITANLFVSTSGTDSDWLVKIIDVYPDTSSSKKIEGVTVEFGNYNQLVRYEMMRGKFRNNKENPEPFKPNEPTLVKINLNDVNHTFKAGHKLKVQIQSSFFPFFDRNPNKFMNVREANEEDFQKVNNRVYFSKKYPSSINFYAN
ncbi:MAG: CocE/NonD family hydrolase [Melioribacteraceae bacterium]|nr:CocE/NonD family hydrolase [Melioribacteraceae bacterium]